MPASMSKLPSSDSTSIEVRDRTEKVTPGCFSRNGVVSRGTMASAVGMAAMRMRPERPCRAARISSRMVRASPTMRRAQSSTCWPSGVSPWKREPRLTSITPSWSSSCLMAADSVGWVMPQFLGRPAEMLLPGERDEEFQLVDHGGRLAGKTVERQIDGPPPPCGEVGTWPGIASD